MRLSANGIIAGYKIKEGNSDDLPLQRLNICGHDVHGIITTTGVFLGPEEWKSMQESAEIPFLRLDIISPTTLDLNLNTRWSINGEKYEPFRDLDPLLRELINLIGATEATKFISLWVNKPGLDSNYRALHRGIGLLKHMVCSFNLYDDEKKIDFSYLYDTSVLFGDQIVSFNDLMCNLEPTSELIKRFAAFMTPTGKLFTGLGFNLLESYEESFEVDGIHAVNLTFAKS